MESNRLLANLQLLDEDNACPASHLRVIGSGFGTLGLSNEILCDGQCFARWHWRGEERIGDDYPDKCYKKGKSPLVSTDWSDTAIVCCEVRKPGALTEGETPLSPLGVTSEQVSVFTGCRVALWPPRCELLLPI